MIRKYQLGVYEGLIIAVRDTFKAKFLAANVSYLECCTLYFLRGSDV